jgi:glutamate synthase domain-containing protein 1
MCGISGIFDFSPSDRLEQSILRMTDTLHHRGPDDSGIWFDQTLGIALGHRRLSILDLSPAGHQPMHSVCGRYVLVFNGEIYNHLALRQALEKDSFPGNIPSEAVGKTAKPLTEPVEVKRFGDSRRRFPRPFPRPSTSSGSGKRRFECFTNWRVKNFPKLLNLLVADKCSSSYLCQ